MNEWMNGVSKIHRRKFTVYLLTFSCLSKWGETNHKVSSSVEEVFNHRNWEYFKENMVRSVQRRYQLCTWLVKIKLMHIYAYWGRFSSCRFSLDFPNPVTPVSMLSLFSICVKHMNRFIHLKWRTLKMLKVKHILQAFAGQRPKMCSVAPVLSHTWDIH